MWLQRGHPGNRHPLSFQGTGVIVLSAVMLDTYVSVVKNAGLPFVARAFPLALPPHTQPAPAHIQT